MTNRLSIILTLVVWAVILALGLYIVVDHNSIVDRLEGEVTALEEQQREARREADSLAARQTILREATASSLDNLRRMRRYTEGLSDACRNLGGSGGSGTQGLCRWLERTGNSDAERSYQAFIDANAAGALARVEGDWAGSLAAYERAYDAILKVPEDSGYSVPINAALALEGQAYARLAGENDAEGALQTLRAIPKSAEANAYIAATRLKAECRLGAVTASDARRQRAAVREELKELASDRQGEWRAYYERQIDGLAADRELADYCGIAEPS